MLEGTLGSLVGRGLGGSLGVVEGAAWGRLGGRYGVFEGLWGAAGGFWDRLGGALGPAGAVVVFWGGPWGLVGVSGPCEGPGGAGGGLWGPGCYRGWRGELLGPLGVAWGVVVVLWGSQGVLRGGLGDFERCGGICGGCPGVLGAFWGLLGGYLGGGLSPMVVTWGRGGESPGGYWGGVWGGRGFESYGSHSGVLMVSWGSGFCGGRWGVLERGSGPYGGHWGGRGGVLVVMAPRGAFGVSQEGAGGSGPYGVPWVPLWSFGVYFWGGWQGALEGIRGCWGGR